MEIEVKFKTNDCEVSSLYFSTYEALGVWISNNYENEVIEITVSEE